MLTVILLKMKEAWMVHFLQYLSCFLTLNYYNPCKMQSLNKGLDHITFQTVASRNYFQKNDIISFLFINLRNILKYLTQLV